MKTISSRQGSFTPFMVILIGLMLTMFLLTYTYFLKSSQAVSSQRQLQIASDDLLASFDRKLLNDYGVLAYKESISKSEILESISLNRKQNESAVFLYNKQDHDEGDIDYNVIETLDNNDTLSDVCIEIARLHLPFEIIEEIGQFYQWQSIVEKKIMDYEKIDDLMHKMQGLQAKVYEYKKVAKDLNNLGGHKVSWFQDVDATKASYEIKQLLNHHKEALSIIESFEFQLVQAKVTYEDCLTADDEMRPFISDLSFDLVDYQSYFSEELSLDQLIEVLDDNIERLEDILDEEDFYDLKNLETDFFVFDKKGDSAWIGFIDELESSLTIVNPSESLFNNMWIKEQTESVMSLNIEEEILLNEYFLSVLKSNVTTSIRDFPLLTRETRESVFSNGEVEYIITGSVTNQLEIYLKVFGLRMASNVVYLISDHDKMTVCKSIGYGIGSWFPAGGQIGTVLVTSLWAGLEACHDVDQLMTAKGVPFIKTDKSWYYDIDLDQKQLKTNTAYVENKEQYSDQYYNDYMRLLLMLTPSEKKINRYKRILISNLDGQYKTTGHLATYVTHHKITWEMGQVEGNYYD